MNDFLRAASEAAMASGRYPDSSRFRIEEVAEFFEIFIDDFEDEHGERPVLGTKEQCERFVEEWMDYVLEELVFIDGIFWASMRNIVISGGAVVAIVLVSVVLS